MEIQTTNKHASISSNDKQRIMDLNSELLSFVPNLIMIHTRESRSITNHLKKNKTPRHGLFADLEYAS